MASGVASMRSPGSVFRMTELERCDNEIRQIERLLRSGHPDIDGLLLALRDWRTERRLLMAADESRSVEA
jgi:hypothetical protein